ncbi:glycosyltransferase [Leuconostoc mesenteroides]|uniref:glycosyltransferase n=1 Tax=Leuconostoc mesenteroides TaxID=1245 RepID=UPI00207373A3|nr:glycosyltransferase [Leuconostoc mesenteroides]
MSKKVLMLAAKANMIQQFNHRNIKILQSLGYEVHVATNMIDFGSMSLVENETFKQWMLENNVIAHQIDFERRIGSIKGNMLSIGQLRRIFRENSFSFVHVHSPLGSILGRYVAMQFKVPVIYTAHGFHFFKGSPVKSWLLYYPVEWVLSFFTEVLIVINKEDLKIASNFHATKVQYIPGVGVDVKTAIKISDSQKKHIRDLKRRELNIKNDELVILSVGELSVRKNQKVILEAISILKKPKIKVLIAGVGPLKNELLRFAEELNISEQVILLGYRNDIRELHYASDINVFPSLQEGLALGGLESVVDGLFTIGSDIRGIRDYIIEDKNGKLFSPKNVKELSSKILATAASDLNVNVKSYSDFLMKFDSESIDEQMVDIYKQF